MLLGKYLNKYYLKYALVLIIGIIALIFVDYYQLFIPEYLGNLVDMFDKNGIDKNGVFALIPKVLFVAFVMFLGRIIWRLTIFYASRKIESDLREKMFIKSEKLSVKFYQDVKVGNVMNLFTMDLEKIEEFLGWGTIMLIDAFFMSILVLYKMFRLSTVLALVMLVPVLLIVLWGSLVEKYMSTMWENSQKEYDKLFDYSNESFLGIRVIKAFVKESLKIKKFAKVANENKEANLKIAKFSVLFDVFISLIIALITSILLGVGGFICYKYVQGSPLVLFGHKVKLSAGELVTFYGYFDTLIWPMMALGQIVTMRSKSQASLKRITNFLDSEEEVLANDGSLVKDIQGKIEFRNFSFSYPGSNSKALDNINLTINKGEKIGICGKIGSGKSTLVMVLLRLYNLNKGEVFIDDEDINDYKISCVRDSISYVPQENFLFSTTVKENIAFSGDSEDMGKVVSSSKLADIEENIEGFKDKYDTLTGERGVSLSGGQKQRVSIARAYYKNSNIMILDDSVSAVDLKTEENILNNINTAREGLTTLVVASRVSTLMHLDKIIVLNEGKLEAFDTPSNLLKTSPTYAKMVFLQKLEKEVEE